MPKLRPAFRLAEEACAVEVAGISDERSLLRTTLRLLILVVLAVIERGSRIAKLLKKVTVETLST